MHRCHCREAWKTRVGVRKIKHRSQVTAYHSPPRADVGLSHTRPFFKKTQYRSVIEYLRANIPAACPGRNDDCRNARAQPNRQAIDEFVRGPRRRDWRRNMIKETAILVEGQDEHCRVEDCGIGGQVVEELLSELLAAGGRVGRVLG